MSRYIDKDKLLDDLNWFCPSEYREPFDEVIEKQPEADVVKVIRCKDCKFYGRTGCNHSMGLRIAFGKDYCSYAERR